MWDMTGLKHSSRSGNSAILGKQYLKEQRVGEKFIRSSPFYWIVHKGVDMKKEEMSVDC